VVAEGHQTTVAEGIVVTEDAVLARIHDLTPDHHVSCLLLSLHFFAVKTSRMLHSDHEILLLSRCSQLQFISKIVF